MAPTPSSPFKKAKFKHSTPRRKNRIQGRWSSGQTGPEIADIEGVEVDHVYRVVKRFTVQDFRVSRPGCGRPSKLDSRDRRYILQAVKRDLFASIP